MSLTARAAAWFDDLEYDDLPAAVAADARLRLLDTIGVALAAVETPIGRAIRAAALAMDGGDNARILGFGDRTGAMAAALANGTLAHALDFDDTHNLSVMHTSAPVVATALAMAERIGAGGEELIAAIAGGNELNCRLGSVVPGGFHQAGFHPTSVIGTLTAALIAGRFLRLDRAALVNAAGITGSQGAGLLEAYSDGTWVKTMHPGWAGHAGIAAALMAEAGFTGPASVLEGRFGLFRSHIQAPDAAFDFDRVTKGLGEHWESLDNSFKPYPCAHAIHPFVDAALHLRREHGLAAEDIDRVILYLAEPFAPVIAEPRAVKVRPLTPTHARASLHYAVAAALVRGHLGISEYDDAAIADPAILALAERIDWTPDPDPGPSDRYKGWVVVETRDGRQIEWVEPANRGSRENPMSAEELAAKFMAGAAPVLGEDMAEALRSAIDRVEETADVRSLMDLTSPR